MPKLIKWNKKHTKVRVWSTVVDAWFTDWMTPDEARNHWEYGDLVKFKLDNICPTCHQKMKITNQPKEE